MGLQNQKQGGKITFRFILNALAAQKPVIEVDQELIK